MTFPATPPHDPAPPRPAVWPWFVTYCVLMAIMYLACALAGAFLLTADPLLFDLGEGGSNSDLTLEELRITGVLLLVLGLPFAAIFAAAPLLPKRPWAWIVNLVLICLSLTSLCCLPVGVPLLIFWIRDEVRHYYGERPRIPEYARPRPW